MNTTLILLTLLTGISGPGPDGTPPRIYRAEDCLVTWQREIDVPAQVAGMLRSVDIAEGVNVSSGDSLAQIDDSKAQMSLTVSQAALQEAQERATNDVNVRFAKAAADLAEVEYRQATDANRRRPDTIPQSEIRRLQLAWQRAQFAVEQAETDQRISGFTLEVKQTEAKATELEIVRYTIKSMLEGTIVEIYRHAGEWVQPGEAVMRIAPMDHLRIEALLQSAEIGPSEVAGRPVRVIAHLERGRTAEFHGHISFVHPGIESRGDYRVWAEVENRMENGQWLLRPGAKAQLEIDMSGEIVQPPMRAAEVPTPAIQQAGYPAPQQQQRQAIPDDRYRNPIRK